MADLGVTIQLSAEMLLLGFAAIGTGLWVRFLWQYDERTKEAVEAVERAQAAGWSGDWKSARDLLEATKTPKEAGFPELPRQPEYHPPREQFVVWAAGAAPRFRFGSYLAGLLATLPGPDWFRSGILLATAYLCGVMVEPLSYAFMENPALMEVAGWAPAAVLGAFPGNRADVDTPVAGEIRRGLRLTAGDPNELPCGLTPTDSA